MQGRGSPIGSERQLVEMCHLMMKYEGLAPAVEIGEVEEPVELVQALRCWAARIPVRVPIPPARIGGPEVEALPGHGNQI